METGFTGMVFRPQKFTRGSPDYRNWLNPTPAASSWRRRQSPVVGRAEAWGRESAQDSPGWPCTGWNYTTLPGQSRYQGVPTASGGLAYLPPEVGLEHVLRTPAGQLVQPPPATISDFLVGVAHPRARFFAGTPQHRFAAGGALLRSQSGFTWHADSSGILRFERAGDGIRAFALTHGRNVLIGPTINDSSGLDVLSISDSEDHPKGTPIGGHHLFSESQQLVALTQFGNCSVLTGDGIGVTGNQTLTRFQPFVDVDASLGNITITLPDPQQSTPVDERPFDGFTYHIARNDEAPHRAVTIQVSGGAARFLVGDALLSSIEISPGQSVDVVQFRDPGVYILQ